MTKKQAYDLKKDIESNIQDSDYTEDLYITIRGIGTKVIKSCTYLDVDGWIFIWTQCESYVFKAKDLGDFLIIPKSDLSLNLC